MFYILQSKCLRGKCWAATENWGKRDFSWISTIGLEWEEAGQSHRLFFWGFLYNTIFPWAVLGRHVSYPFPASLTLRICCFWPVLHSPSSSCANVHFSSCVCPEVHSSSCFIAKLHFHSWFGKAPALVDKLLFRLNTTFWTHFHSTFLLCLLLTYFCAHILSQSVIDIGLIFSLHTTKGLLDKKNAQESRLLFAGASGMAYSMSVGINFVSTRKNSWKEGDDFQPS